MSPPNPAQDSLEKVSSHEAKPDMGESGSLDEKSGADFDILVTGLTSQDRESLTEEESKKLLRRIDFMVVPIMALLYGLQYLDKILINYAAVMGFKADTGMDTDKYSYLAMIFYISYVVFEFPHSWGIQKFPVAKYLSTMVILWGVVVTVTCACKNYAGLVATRVLLGIFEAAVAPALIIITTM
ncbi:hypothetical protein NCS52_00778800 [Fusarium sp. LHS14.1]|nr:hypothetical protein NCS52_00778800 [Fusarium sp. LHS14.1]